jgi:hypothetical protein
VKEMRVSKEVRNFIGEQVREIFAKDSELEMKVKEKESLAKEIVEEYNQKIIDFLESNLKELNEKIKELGFETYLTSHWNSKRTGFDTSVNEFYLDSHSETYKEQRQVETQRQEKITKAIQDIIITLELGGNKQDLMNMLEKLKEDNK